MAKSVKYGKCRGLANSKSCLREALFLQRIASATHSAALASLGMRQSPRGDNVTEPTLGPSGRQLRLNCWEKKRL